MVDAHPADERDGERRLGAARPPGFTWAQGGDKDLSVMAEYYYNGLGFARSDYDQVIQYSRNSLTAGGRASPMSSTNTELGVARHYCFARVAGNIEDELGAQLWVVANLQDFSCVTGAVLTYTKDAWAISGALIDAWVDRIPRKDCPPTSGGSISSSASFF